MYIPVALKVTGYNQHSTYRRYIYRTIVLAFENTKVYKPNSRHVGEQKNGNNLSNEEDTCNAARVC